MSISYCAAIDQGGTNLERGESEVPGGNLSGDYQERIGSEGLKPHSGILAGDELCNYCGAGWIPKRESV